MKIDYSVNDISKYFLFLDLNVRWGARHVQAALSPAPISLASRVSHFVRGALMCLPVLGHLIAFCSSLLSGRVEKIQLKQTDPFNRGIEMGQLKKDDIQFLYTCIKMMIGEKIASHGRESFQRSVENLREHISPHVQREMLGIAVGADVSFQDVLEIHTFIDIFAGTYGCSALATAAQGERLLRVSATNDLLNGNENLGDGRKQLLDSAPLRLDMQSHKEALKLTNMEDTIQSVVFDCKSKEVEIASSWERAARTVYSKLQFFKKKRDENPRTPKAFAAFNLDWPWKVLAPYTTLVRSKSRDGLKSFVNVTFPGYLGVLRGMNEDGVAIGCCQAGSYSQADAMPVTLLFRDILENANSAQGARERLATLRPASSMNVVVAAPDGAFAAELNPSEAETGFVGLRLAHS